MLDDVDPEFCPPVQKFFSVPEHTPLYIAEAGDCGCTLVRIHCQDAAGQHESRLLEQHTPHWILDYVEKVCMDCELCVCVRVCPRMCVGCACCVAVGPLSPTLLSQNCLPPYIKVNFSSAPHPESFLSEDRSRK